MILQLQGWYDLGKVRLNFYMNEKVEDEILAVDETRYMSTSIDWICDPCRLRL